MKFIGVIFLGLFIFGAAFSGCSKSSDGKAGTKDIFFHALQSEPADLHPIRASEVVTTQVIHQGTHYASNVIETLLVHDLKTYDMTPNLAERWEVSKDGKEFTFYLRKDVKFHDGSMMTAEDVKFSFEALFDNAYESYSLRSYYGKFENKAEVIDKYTVKFRSKSSYYLNLTIIGELRVIPKAFYSKQTKETRFAKVVMGSGAYKFEKWNQGKSITLVQNPDWWGNKDAEASKQYNFKKVVFKFVKEAGLRRAMLERGKLDFDFPIRPEDFVKKMSGKPWGDTVLKVKAENKVPKNLNFVGLNNKNKIFKDRRVRYALAHLVNRDFLNEKFYYGMSNKATGPFRVQSDYSNPNVKPVPYSPETAKKMLFAAGWADTDKDGLLDKVIDGVKTQFVFNLLNANKDSEKVITVIKEDMRKAGVKMVIETIDWNAFTKALNERKFDSVIMAWGGGGVHPDPTQIWHSKSAEGTGSNFVSYSNPKVDALIEKGINIVNKAERIKVFHQIHKLIAEDAPYLFYFEPKYNIYAVSSKVIRPADTQTYSVGAQTWALPE